MEEVAEETKIKDEVLHPTFPLIRFCYFGHYRAYYPFGNTPAEDYLEHCLNTLHPSVLALGCGDLRSCFYTLWKNFDYKISSAPKRFNSMSITFNDYSAAIMARNIMFIYMCVNLPRGGIERAKWLCTMWAIWYCHELYPHHLDALNKSLKALLSFSDSLDSWSKKENPLHSLVSFTSTSCLSEVSHMWNLWLRRAINVSKQEMHEARNQLLRNMINDKSEHSLNLSRGHTLIFGDAEKVSLAKAVIRAPEVKSYLDSGSCYAEHVVGFNLPPKTKTKVNLTMYERPDGMYTCHYGLVPFECYFQTVEFSPQYLKPIGRDIPYDVIVPTESFKSKPFLSNSVQQFFMWIQSSHRALNEAQISFTFDIQDAIALCQHQNQLNSFTTKDNIPKHKYDIINTSNLMDHLGASNLILACTPLLKDGGVITTLSLCCRGCTNTGEEMLSLLFGFCSSLLPVILGVRCISHEGKDYSNSVGIKPSAPDISHFLKCLPHVRIFIWVKEVKAQELIFSILPPVQDGNITEALVNMFGICTYALLNHGPGESKNMLSRNGIETALSVLKVFEGLSGQSSPTHSYWGPLCTAIKGFTPYLQCLQTQFLLHNVHAHLVVSEEDCPLCHRVDLKERLGLFCFRIKSDLINYGTPYLMAFVHRYPSTDPEFLQKKALSGGDVHIFDCFDDACTERDLHLKFFAPLKFAQKKYKVSLIYIHRTNTDNILVPVSSLPLEDIRAPWTEYAFYQAEHAPKQCLKSSFGTITSHNCDSMKSETEISLSELTLKALSSSKLETSKQSSREVMLKCGGLHMCLRVSYPINYNSVKISLSKSKGLLSLSCQRQVYGLQDERPCFIASPDHKLSLLPSTLDSSYFFKHAQMQVKREEAKFLQAPHTAHLCSAESKFRVFLQVLFECALRDCYFQIKSPNSTNCCLMTVNEVLFDYNNKTPAIDLAYCFTNQFDPIALKWLMIVGSSYSQTLPLEDTGMNNLEDYLKYFSLRTHGTIQSAGSSSRLSTLLRSNIDREFTRAVVYFLLCDPDMKLYAVGDYFGFTTANFMPQVGGTSCGNCKKLTFTAKKCGQCGNISYCSKKCQMSHWPLHKQHCSSLKDVHHSKCTNCKATLNSQGQIKKPICECTDIQYCGSDCMLKDQPRHRKVCKSSKMEPSKNQGKSSASDAKLSKCSFCNAELLWSEKCPECHEAEYCNLDCQTKHWPSHKMICKKVLDTEDPETAKSKCCFCKKPNSCLKKCTKCSQVLYCNQTCQRNHWPQHRSTCLEYQKLKETTKAASVSQEKCSFCYRTCSNLRKCTRCKKVQYCGTDCQSKDWSKHKKTCGKASESQENTEIEEYPTLLCSFCERKSYALKKCLKCGNVQYCNRSCQEKDWPNHKNHCTDKTRRQDSCESVSGAPILRCSYCMKSIQNTVKCPQCDAEQYCSPYCQQKDWHVHKFSCSGTSQARSVATASCASCGSTSRKLFTCKRCCKTKYCGKECQVTDWKNHKSKCIKKHKEL